MNNETLIPKLGVITDVRIDTPDVKTFRVVSPEGEKLFQHRPVDGLRKNACIAVRSTYNGSVKTDDPCFKTNGVMNMSDIGRTATGTDGNGDPCVKGITESFNIGRNDLAVGIKECAIQISGNQTNAIGHEDSFL